MTMFDKSSVSQKRVISSAFLTVILAAAGSASAQQIPAGKIKTLPTTINIRDIDANRELVSLDRVNTANLRRLLVPFTGVDKARLEKIADTIESQVKDQCVGYSFVVAYGTAPGLTVARAGGVARRAPDPNPRTMKTDDRVMIASVSKTMTAITLLKLLDEKKIPLTTTIKPYLPKELSTDPTVEKITFAEILNHTSGLRDIYAFGNYTTLRKNLTTPVNASDKKFKYQNVNYSLMRLMIPYIEDNFVPPASADDYAKDYLYGVRLMEATRKRVFQPLGITGTFCAYEDPNKTLSYQFPSPVQKGQDWGDFTSLSGFCGWYLTADEMSKVIRGLLYSEKLLNKTQRETMLSSNYGIFHTMVGGMDEYGHGGWIPASEKANNYPFGTTATTMVGYSNGVSVALVMNSDFGTSKNKSSEQPIRAALLQDLKQNPPPK
jgi:CubicO group peptidase (beta-lactamase class C family)